eukprot:1143901-Pelagomonas_calceolata.AAC.4
MKSDFVAKLSAEFLLPGWRVLGPLWVEGNCAGFAWLQIIACAGGRGLGGQHRQGKPRFQASVVVANLATCAFSVDASSSAYACWLEASFLEERQGPLLSDHGPVVCVELFLLVWEVIPDILSFGWTGPPCTYKCDVLVIVVDGVDSMVRCGLLIQLICRNAFMANLPLSTPASQSLCGWLLEKYEAE